MLKYTSEIWVGRGGGGGYFFIVFPPCVEEGGPNIIGVGGVIDDVEACTVSTVYVGGNRA